MPARHRARPRARPHAGAFGRSAVAALVAGSALTAATTAVVALDASAAAEVADRRAVALAVSTPAPDGTAGAPPAPTPTAAPTTGPTSAPPSGPATAAEPQPTATVTVTEAPSAPMPVEPVPVEPPPAAEPPEAAGGTDAETSRRILVLLEQIRLLLEADAEQATGAGDGDGVEDVPGGDVGTAEAPLPPQDAPPQALPPQDTPPPAADAAPGPGTAPAVDARGPFAAGRPWVDPDTDAVRAAASAPDPAQRQALQQLADEGSATWVGGWSGDPATAVGEVVAAARAASQTPTFVLYNVPDRDCGSYSAGGASGPEDYRQWIEGVAQGLEGAGAVVVLEPDALAGMDCLAPDAQGQRVALLADAAERLDAAGATVYLDAGTPAWQPVDVMAERLAAAGVGGVRGFALNVSNYQSVADNEAYGDALVAALGGGARYVIDTSRNGNGPSGDGGEGAWCNPAGRAVGERFTTRTGNDNVDALLWIKVPGDSDGTCGGGPAAGEWWPERALELAGGGGRGPATPWTRPLSP